MKTYKHLYKKLCSYENLFLAYKKARKGKTRKNYVLEFESNLHENLRRLQRELVEKTYMPNPIVTMIIRDPKTRKIGKASFRDRIVHHALINILEPIFELIFIYDSYASRKNKGHHKALERFNEFKRKVSNNGSKLNGINDNNYVSGYVLKADIAKYFENINHDVLISILKEKIKDNDLIWLVSMILEHENNSSVKGKGMPLGNYTSQFFANIYLNKLDYFVKHALRAKYYIRYVDDFVILHGDKEILSCYKEKIRKFLFTLGLKLHDTKSRILALHHGIPLLGFRVFFYHRLLKKSGLTQITKNIEIWKREFDSGLEYEKITEKLQGWLAHAKHGNTYRFRESILTKFSQIINQ